jgi:lipopolysaccharide transport system permease protein
VAEAFGSEVESAATARGTGETVLIEAPRGFARVDLRELWSYRELAWYLALRDLRVRYKQSILGVAWAVLQPLLTMVVFSLLFGLLLGRDGKPTLAGVPYAVSTFCALVPWQLFATALTTSGNSLVTNQHLITRVYFPRLVAPIAPILAALLDFALAFAVLLAMMACYGIFPGPGILALPLFVALAVAAALSVSLWLSALNAVYRDVRHAIPFVVQIWMFATPVVYTTASVMGGRPEWLRWLYALNPMAGVVEGFRFALLGGPAPAWGLVAGSAVIVALLLTGGLFFFRRMERSFADLV